MMRLAIPALVLLLASSAANAETFAGRASVIDADTIDIHGQRIRLLDIDAPESRQPCIRPDGAEWRCGQKAALALADWIGTSTVSCETEKKDRYNRWLTRCSVADQDLALWLAESGWVFAYRDCKCEVIRAAVDRARADRLGIWSGEAMAPWEWRDKN
jgi:endonuclease YncB( thermonuclease family)